MTFAPSSVVFLLLQTSLRTILLYEKQRLSYDQVFLFFFVFFYDYCLSAQKRLTFLGGYDKITLIAIGSIPIPYDRF